MEYLRNNGENSLNILMANREALKDETGALPYLNVLNLLGRIATANQVSVMTVGCSEKTLNGLQNILHGVMRLIIIRAARISEEIRDFITTFNEVLFVFDSIGELKEELRSYFDAVG